MAKINLQTARDLSARVDEATRSLNEAIYAAAIAGLVIEVETVNIQQVGTYGVTTVQAVAKVKPDDIAA